MLAKAARNCRRYHRSNLRLARTLEETPAQDRGFSFIHSHIVLQHLAARRGLDIIRALPSDLQAGGLAGTAATSACGRASRLNLLLRRPSRGCAGASPGAIRPWK
jgi:hypothetical protein